MVLPAIEYMTDAAQRTVLFWDVMRQRGNQYREHLAETAPNVLDYSVELVIDGRTLERPVNYVLVRVVPPKGVEIDVRRRPFVIVDPRAGHGPGIGGFKADSEIGVAMKAGHPCYFVGFLPDPVPGQTIEDVARAEAVFLEKVIALHPEADGKPCVIGNCQAGWAVMMLASVRPELFGPIIAAGSPLSYWNGVHGRNPMRYSGGLLGGSWLTALTCDLGNGKFDGAWLVQNFENLNPSNTLWTKQYSVYSKVDSEGPRYLGFERWWGGHINLNAEEIQFIVDELFVGNKLVAGEIQTSDGRVLDLRNIRSPIVVFCSEGDNITPPQQALGWILDLYESVDDIRAHGQTIVYSVHQKIGHLGIFVSGGIARKEHSEFSSNIDLIDVLPPGLYEATFERKGADTVNPDLAVGDWVMRCEHAHPRRHPRAGWQRSGRRSLLRNRGPGLRNKSRALPHLRAAVRARARQPADGGVDAEAAPAADHLRAVFRCEPDDGDAQADDEHGPASIAAPPPRTIRSSRWQENMSKQIVAALDAWRDARDRAAEKTFFAIYGSPALQAAVGVDPASTQPLRRPAKDLLHQEMLHKRIAELRARMPVGGVREATIRALLYVGGARSAVDERGFEIVRRIRRELHEFGRPAAAGIQDAGARAVLHAADRRGRSAGGNSRRCCRTTRSAPAGARNPEARTEPRLGRSRAKRRRGWRGSSSCLLRAMRRAAKTSSL